MSRSLVSVSKAAEMLGVHDDTLRIWDKQGVLVPIRTAGNHRRYKVSDIKRLLNENPPDKPAERNRVVTSDKDFLDFCEKIQGGFQKIIVCSSEETLSEFLLAVRKPEGGYNTYDLADLVRRSNENKKPSKMDRRRKRDSSATRGKVDDERVVEANTSSHRRGDKASTKKARGATR